jgi:hypothetical protein
MPFDGLPEGVVSDLVKLRIALDGIKNPQRWAKGSIGLKDELPHCAIGWLMSATDGDLDETTRLALKYVYPALPPKAQKAEKMYAIWTYNDTGGHKRMISLFSDAVRLAEQVH